MNSYNPNIHHRKSIRLKGYDYSQEGLYFITICCQDRICFFGEVINGEMILNEYGKIALDEWMKTPVIRPNVELGEFVVMPNHIHGVIRLTGRGELHSPPLITTEPNSPKTKTEFYKPEITGNGGVNDLSRINELSDKRGECNLNESINANECNSPQPNYLGVNDLSRINDLSGNGGECNSPLRGPTQTIGAIIRGYKSSVTKQLGLMGFNGKLWQRNYYEHIIRDDYAYQNISEYIVNNPAKWEQDKFYTK